MMGGETEALALSRLSFALAKPSEGEAEYNARIQAGIDATMREVIKTASYNPNALSPPVKTTPLGAVPAVEPRSRNGWADEVPLRSPPGQGVIERMVDAALPHGPAWKREKEA
jgi:hypothetical protein